MLPYNQCGRPTALLAQHSKALYFQHSSVIKKWRGVLSVFPAISWQTGFLLLTFNSLPLSAFFTKVLRRLLYSEPSSSYFREITWEEEGWHRVPEKSVSFSKACWNYFSLKRVSKLISLPFQFPITQYQPNRITCYA